MPSTIRDGDQTDIALDQLKPNPANPRTDYDPEALFGLAGSIEAVGLLQPIIVRPDPAGGYVVVCGHRRMAAAQSLGWTHIAAVYRDLTDAQAMDMAMVENLQREDLTPMDEAAGYKALQDSGKGIAEIAASVNRARSHVAARLQLLVLPEEAIGAIIRGDMTLAVAGEIARLPGQAQREEATKLILAQGGMRWDHDTNEEFYEPVSYRRARQLIADRFLTDLASAPFDVNDPDLVPAAGSCASCPRRSGNDLDLFGNLAAFGDNGADVCTYAPCFTSKREAHVEALLADAKSKGLATISPKKAARLFQAGGALSYNAPYVEASAAANAPGISTHTRKSWRTTLGKKAPQEYAAVSPTGKLVKLYDKKEAVALLAEKVGVKADGPGAAPPAPARGSWVIRDEAARKARGVMCDAVAANAGLRWREIMRSVAVELMISHDEWEIGERRGIEEPTRENIIAFVNKLSDYDVQGLIAEIALVDLLHFASVRHLDDDEAAVMAHVEDLCGFHALDVVKAAREAAGLTDEAEDDDSEEDCE